MKILKECRGLRARKGQEIPFTGERGRGIDVGHIKCESIKRVTGAKGGNSNKEKEVRKMEIRKKS